MVKKGRSRREEKSHSEWWGCRAFPGRFMAVFCRAFLPG